MRSKEKETQRKTEVAPKIGQEEEGSLLSLPSFTLEEKRQQQRMQAREELMQHLVSDATTSYYIGPVSEFAQCRVAVLTVQDGFWCCTTLALATFSVLNQYSASTELLEY